jgi:hypothetical protein
VTRRLSLPAMSWSAKEVLTRDTCATRPTWGVAEFLLDSLVERRAMVSDASVWR